MSNLLRAELLKLRTTRTFAALVGSAVALSLLVVVLTSILSKDITEQDARDLFTADFTGLFILLLGVMGAAGEWRHRTITSSVLAAPDRTRLLAAKTIAYALAGAVLSLIVSVTIMAVGTLILSARGKPTVGIGDLVDVLWRNLTVSALLGAFGVCIGALVRNQVVAIIGLLIFAFVLEPTLANLVPSVGRFGPTSGAPNAIVGNTGHGDEHLRAGVAVVVMLGWIGAGFAAGAALLRGRDLL
ncbi:MAG: type transport system permease protein [Thermoleophilaceae bacterium]|nr:type transport system permease protein [Thermoleophilaceae bacterium]